jgi:hypothetical protein
VAAYIAFDLNADGTAFDLRDVRKGVDEIASAITLLQNPNGTVEAADYYALVDVEVYPAR